MHGRLGYLPGSASKTDTEQQGSTVAISRGGRTCPIAALNTSLSTAGIQNGPGFRPVLNFRCRETERFRSCSSEALFRNAVK
jgi:hypothetical protein